MSLTMQRLLPTVVLPMVALAGLGVFLRKDKPEAQAQKAEVTAPAVQVEFTAMKQSEAARESCAVNSGAAVDATRVVCLTEQLHVHDVSCATCAPEPITDAREHITGFAVTADGKHVVFASDATSAQREGNYSLFRYDIETRRRVELTPDETLDRDAPRLPRKRPDLAIYSARTQGEAATKVFAQSLASGEKAKLVYVDPEPGELVDVSDDGTRGVFRRFISPEKSVYLAVDFRKHES